MKNSINAIIVFIAITVPFNCDTSTQLVREGDTTIFETIEHSAVHMQDESGLAVAAAVTMPGPHLGEDDFGHQLLSVTLPSTDGGYCGYIHFGPDITGDIMICIDSETDITVTNRSTQGDSPVEMERTFTAQEISDSIGTSLIKKAVLFEAQTGGNILRIGPATQSTVKMVIEEVEHEHED